ncbi:baseplate assembly protein, putative [Plesiocystis pacifica SIR-1]|uniref:Baseplate assembly protein, putative n=1 Tax=Plesiocystis pacifica SIR-1 TaxID=391625 RepID=A6FZ37_9BACT|nr:baseplate J/gp47 family protein [Plesiocystis pacifica]EDM81192.1 baseplate assembly protein, putative [Plesiocystis pacifica SIR-1]
MKFDDRSYEDIVRDLLTQLTGGVANEVHVAGADMDRLTFHAGPVRRVSYLAGKVEGKHGPADYRWTEREFALVAADDDPDAYVGVQLRPRAPRPIAGSSVTVNYYPRRMGPTPITDVQVGSVARTMLETIAREMATQYVQLQRVYESAFVETSTGRSLDRVSALVDTRRIEKGHPVGKVRFTRRQGAAGAIFIPAGTAVTDGGGARYLTTDDARMQPTQSTVEVWVHGESKGTALAEPGALVVIERAIAGVDRVSNEAGTSRASEAEGDDQLASRARRAIHAAGKGTLDALRSGLEGLPFVSGVSFGEYREGPDSPVPMPGMLRVDVALSEDTPRNRAVVARTIDGLRPAGIHVSHGYAQPLNLDLGARLTLAGSKLEYGSLDELEAEVRRRLESLVGRLGPGSTLRRSALITATLEDPRIVDAELDIVADGQAVAGASFSVPGDRSPKAAVQFAQHAFEALADASAASVISVHAHVSVAPLPPGGQSSTVEAELRARLEAMLAGLGPGETLAFLDVLDALRDTEGESHPRWVLVSEATVLQLDSESGVSTRLVAGGSTVVPGDASFSLDALTLEVLTQ